jgi:predicted O-methyltransferase YrrM
LNYQIIGFTLQTNINIWMQSLSNSSPVAGMQTWIQRSFLPIKRALPTQISDAIRSVLTAFVAPILAAYKQGHFRSAFARRAVDRHGKPIPWYTYPCIDFLRYRSFSHKRVLEFGAGQSTLWWASVAESVFALEGDEDWCAELKKCIPENVTLRLVDAASVATCLSDVSRAIKDQVRYDIVVIDGLWRSELVPIAMEILAPGGAIICDNAEGYGIYEAFKGSNFRRIDFYGNAPGVVLQHCTSIFFRGDCFLLDTAAPICTPTLE